MEISDEALRNVEGMIERWGRLLLDAARDDDRPGARMYSNWLFGAQTVLNSARLYELAQAAFDAQMAERRL